MHDLLYSHDPNTAEARLRQLEVRLKETEELAHIGRWEWEAATDTNFWSPELYRIFGWEPGAAAPGVKGYVELTHPDDRERAGAAAGEAIATGRPYSIEHRIVRPTGEVRYILGRGRAVLDDDGRVRRMYGTALDITDRVRAEEGRACLEARLEQVARLESVGELASGIAHDFNNLLAVVRTYAAVLSLRLDDDEDLAPAVAEIRRAADRGAALIHKLLLFSRHEAAEPTLLDLSRLVAETIDLVGPSLGSEVRVDRALARDLPPVRMDPSHVDRLLVNLLVNGRDAMTDGGTITVRTERVDLSTTDAALPSDATGVRLTVSDTGSGMPEHVVRRAFQPFFTTKPKGSGTGLGLATVYGIVKGAGGDVQIRSRPGAGTAIVVDLPTREECGSTAPLASRPVPG